VKELNHKEIKMLFTTTYRSALLALAALIASSMALGQSLLSGQPQATCMKAGSQTTITATFTGPYAKELTDAQLQVSTKPAIDPGQKDLNTSFWSDGADKVPGSPGVFSIRLTVPMTVADGEYSVSIVRTYFGGINKDYPPPSDFRWTFQVCNQKFEWPRLDHLTHP